METTPEKDKDEEDTPDKRKVVTVSTEKGKDMLLTYSVK
jgi:hypothetical protein